MLKKTLIFMFSITSLLLLQAVFSQPQPVSVQTAAIEENLKLTLDLQPTAALNIPLNPQYQYHKDFVSDVKQTKFPFGALSIEWQEEVPAKTSLHLKVRFLEDNTWSDWLPVAKDQDGQKPDITNNPTYTSLVITNHASAFQYKAELESEDESQTPVLKKITLTYFNAEDKVSFLKTNWLASLQVMFDKNPKIVSRSSWGADESLRIFKNPLEDGKKPIDLLHERDKEFYEKYKDEINIEKVVETNSDGQYLTWPIEYATDIKKIIIHHTATAKDLDNPKEAIRNIYYYHAIVRGWGDIGYNYIVAPDGSLYEGRTGGEKAVGAHASGFNHGTIGIAVLGNYSDTEIPLPALKSLIHLAGQKSAQYKIKPDGFSVFHEQKLPNILGHRDVGDTTCPGHNLYPELTYVRGLLASSLSADTADASTGQDFSYFETATRSIVSIKPEKTATLKLSLKNTGIQTWNKDSFIRIDPNPDTQYRLSFEKNSVSGQIASLDQTKVAPGETGTFTIKATAGLKGGLISLTATPVFNGTATRPNLLLPFYVEEPSLSYEVFKLTVPTPSVQKKAQIKGSLMLRNTGNVAWKKDGDSSLKLGTDQPRDHVSIFTGQTRLANLEQAEVKPGEFGLFNFTLTAPNRGGNYTEFVRPVMENIGWLKGADISFTVKVLGNEYKSEFVGTSQDILFEPHQSKNVWIKIKNIGDVSWPATGKNALKVIPIKNRALKNIPILEAANPVNPGDTIQLSFRLTAPTKPGQYKIYFWPRVGSKKLTKKPYYYKFTVTAKKTPPSISDEEGLVRIKLSFEEPTAQVTANGNFSVYQDSNKIAGYSQDDTVEVSLKDNKYLLKNNQQAVILENPPRFIPDKEVILELKNFDRRPSWNPATNDNQYRGNLEINIDDNKLIVINELPLEDYLKGMAEEPNDTPMAKLKVMSILARSYAKYHRDHADKFPGKPYDGSDDPSIYQKYVGYGYEKRAPNVVKSVEETRGLIVTYNGQPVLTPYFSQSDGRTRSAEEVFGWQNTPYLQSVPDPFCAGKKLLGHGVGLSGCGALAAAKQGKTYEEIIKYYYQGVEIKKVY